METGIISLKEAAAALGRVGGASKSPTKRASSQRNIRIASEALAKMRAGKPKSPGNGPG